MKFNQNFKSFLYTLQLIFLVSVTISIHSCKSQNTYNKGKQTSINNSTSGRAKKVLKKANTFMGTKYKYGGNSKRGIDCSGLVCQSFDHINIKTPRTAREQAKFGIKVKRKNLKPGDLLFFNTSGSGITHTGIVHHIKGAEIFFIHASSSKGVMISSLENSYWKKRYKFARRYIH